MLEFAASSIAYDCVMSLLYLKKRVKDGHANIQEPNYHLKSFLVDATDANSS